MFDGGLHIKPLKTMEKWKQESLLRRGLRYLAPYVRARRRMLAGAITALLTGTAVELIKPWPLKFVFDYLLKDKNFLPSSFAPPFGDSRTWLLVFVCGLILLVWSLSSVAAYFREYLLSRLAEEVVFELRVALFGHLQRLSLSFHDSRRVGDMMTRVTGDTDSLRELVSGSVLDWFTAILALAGTIAVMLYMDWQLAIVGIVTISIMGPVEWSLRHRIKEAAWKKRAQEVEVTSLTEETMSSLRLVKAFGREKHQQRQFGHESSESVRAGVESARLEAQYVRTVDIISALATCAVVWFGVQRVYAGKLTPGDLYVFINYVRGFTGPLRDIAKQSIKLAKAKVGLQRVLEVLETSPAAQDGPGARQAPVFRGAIEFRDVSFAYRPEQPVLKDISFRVEPGQVVALVGYSGAGKSTILSLLPRLYEASTGLIKIDGEDIRSFQLDSLREQISIVLQESVLFQATILENILYGRPDATEDEVEEAARAAGVHPFVGRLKNGYKTVVGPRGVTLSGGERQRVAIARAMVRGAPILVLDEPTTGLDVESERLVMDALERLMVGKTTLLISHKLNLIERVHKVLVIDGGRIVESGTPEELRASGGLYARLHEVAAANHGIIDDRPGQPLPERNSKLSSILR